MYLSFDIGGSATKIAIIDEDSKIVEKYKVDRLETLEEFIKMLEKESKYAIEEYGIKGIGFSSPGTVNPKTGEVLGMSALPYIHTYNFANHIKEKFDIFVSIENDANCSALAQLFFDPPKEDDFAFVVIGSGIGGAIIEDGKLRNGRRLESGEFGYMLLKKEGDEFTNLSLLGTLPNTARRIKDKYGIDMDTYELMERYQKGESPYYEEVDEMFTYLCMGLYNIQYTYDPKLIFIGGGISQSEAYIKALKEKLSEEPFAGADIQLRTASFYNDNNLLGAYANLRRKMREGDDLCTQ